MALNEELDHVNVHSEDTFKVTSDDWLGVTASGSITTTTTVQRLSATSKRFRNLKISNCQGGYTGYIGKYYSNAATFIASAFRMNAVQSEIKFMLEFDYIDLYELGCRTIANATTFKWIGINQY